MRATDERGQPSAQRAIWMLAFVTVLWGSTFTVTPIILNGIDDLRMAHLTADPTVVTRPATAEEMTAAGATARRFVTDADLTPTFFCVVRFGLVALVMPIFFWRRLARTTKAAVWAGFWLGVVTAAGFLAQTYGLQRTTPAMSAFFTALYVPFTPILVWLIWRKWPSRSVGGGIAVSIVGVAVMAFFAGDAAAATVEMPAGIPLLGELLNGLSAVMFAAQIILADRLSRNADPVVITFYMMLATAVICAVPLPFFATAQDLLTTPVIGAMAANPEVLVGTAFTALGPTFVAFLVVIHYQKCVDPSRAGLVYALEPVCAAGISVALAIEALLPAKFIGGGLIVVGNLVAEWRTRRQETRLARNPRTTSHT